MTTARQTPPPRRRNPVILEHLCGWARVNGVWTCIQDYYAEGHRPDTACGRTWAPQGAKKE